MESPRRSRHTPQYDPGASRSVGELRPPGGLERIAGITARIEEISVAGRTLRLYVPTDPDSLLDAPATVARFAREEYMPYWAMLWPGAILLAEFIATRPPQAGRALDLGCGLGLTAIAAAAAGWKVVASDYDSAALAFVRASAALNRVHLADVRHLDWRRPPPGDRFDWLFGADLLYEKRLLEEIPLAVRTLLRPEGCAWLADPGRSVAAAFPECARAAGLTVGTIAVQASGPDGRPISGTAFELTHSRRPGQ